MVRLDDANATAVYGVSVDSRSRPPSQPDNKYEIDLGRTLDRVKSLQLGSIQIPDCRYAFDSKSMLQYSEPITILPNTHLFVAEKVTTRNFTTNTTTVETRVIQVLVPPTLNKILACTDADNAIVQTQYDTGLNFGIRYYPLIGQQLSLVGAHFPQTLMQSPMPAPFPPQAGPVLSATTVQVHNGGYLGPSGVVTDTNKSYQYIDTYLSALLQGVSPTFNFADRHILTAGPNLCAWSYLFAPKPTLTELFTMLNAALDARVNVPDIIGTIASITNSGGFILVTTTVPHGLAAYDQVTIVGADVAAANGTVFITAIPANNQFLLPTAWPGGAAGTTGVFTSPQGVMSNIQFGYDDQNSLVIAIGAPYTRTTSTGDVTRTYSLVNGPAGTVSLADYLGYGEQNLYPQAVANLPQYILRTVKLRAGNYTASELSSITNVRMNPLLFEQTPTTQRTLNYKLPTGVPASLIIPCGRYTATQIVDYLNFYLNPGPANIQVSVNTTTGKFTFTQQFGLPFSLVFDGNDNLFTAYNFGFEPVTYSGSSTYTSVNNAFNGVAVSTKGYNVNPYPSNTYTITSDSTQSHFTFDTGGPDNAHIVADHGTNDTSVCPYTAVWNPLYDCAQLLDGWCASWFPGDVLYGEVPFAFGTIISYAGCVVKTSGPHGLINGQSVTLTCNALAGTYTVSVTDVDSFTIFPCTVPITISGTGGYFASNSTCDLTFFQTNNITFVNLTVGVPNTVDVNTPNMTWTPADVGKFIKIYNVQGENVNGTWEIVAVPGGGGTDFTAQTYGSATPGTGYVANTGYVQVYNLAHGDVSQYASTGGLYEMTTVLPHGLQTGDYVKLVNTGATPPDGVWQLTVTSLTTFTLDGSAYAGIVTLTPGAVFTQVNGIVVNASNASPIVITSSSANNGVINNSVVSVLEVGGNTAANGSWPVTVISGSDFALQNSTGSGGYTSGGFYLFDSNLSCPQVATNVYTVVVKQSVDMSSGLPSSLQLEPTVSIFSTLQYDTINEALGDPNAAGPSDLRRIYLQAATRDVFQLFFSHPDAKAANFGFPAVSYPPSMKTLQMFYAPSFPTYNDACGCVPIANTYQSPFCWNLLPPDYILMLLCQPCGSKDVHTHTWKKVTKPILAKLYITSPYLNISEQMLFSIFAGFQRINKIAVEFQNPDGSLVEFNGRPHNYELLFTLYEDSADTKCL